MMHLPLTRNDASMRKPLLFLPAFLVAVFVWIPALVHAEFIGDERNYEVIREDTVWSGSFAQADVRKPVIILDGAAVTIDPGTHVEISRLQIFNGRIIARGTESRPITFTTMPEDWSWLPPSYEQYDRECFHRRIPEGSVEFFDLADDETGALNEASVFEYTIFENMGSYIEHDGVNCPFSQARKEQKLPFVRTAIAAEPYLREVPAFRFFSGHVRMDHVVFRDNNFTDIVVETFVDTEWGEAATLHITDSDFEKNVHNDTAVSSAIAVYGEEGEITGEDKEPYLENILLSHNWYGNASGPEAEGNEGGNGAKLEGDFTLDGWSDTANVEFNTNSSVLFLPGLKASKLYTEDEDGDEDQLWLPTLFSDDIEQLAMDESGASEASVYTRDVLSSIPTGNLYQSFLNSLDEMKTAGTIVDWEAFAYDWRYDVFDIVEHGIAYPDGETKSLVETIERLAETSHSGKVTIVTHSNGGLLAKALLVKLEEQGRADLADKVVFVGTPQIGTPITLLSLLYGYEEAVRFFYSDADARELGETMPGAYGLLPSDAYLDLLGASDAYDSFVQFTSKNTRYEAFRDAYGEDIDSYEEFLAFLEGSEDERDEPGRDDTEKENTLRRSLLEKTTATHAALDNWTPPESVEVVQIAGWGLDTVSGLEYTEEENVSCPIVAGFVVPICEGTGEYEPVYEPKFTVDGDNTVVTPSALFLDDDAENVERWWVDLYRSPRVSGKLVTHKNIFELSSVTSFLSEIIRSEVGDDLPGRILSSRPNDYEGAADRIRISLHSPLHLHFYDDAGNHTGPGEFEVKSENGGVHTVEIIETEIPGSSYFRFGERTYVSIPAGEEITIEMNGYGEGSYTLRLEEISFDENGDEVLGDTITLKNLPVSEDTTATLSISEMGLEGMSDLEADFNGEEEGGEYAVEPVINGEATFDPGPTDTTYPEARISFDPDTKTLAIAGIDDISDSENITVETENFTEEKTIEIPCRNIPWWKRWRVEPCEKTITRDFTRATLADEAGNATELVFETKTERNGMIHILPISISYGEQTHAFSRNGIKYLWRNQWRRHTPQWIFASLRADASFGMGIYQSRKNQTKLWMYPDEEGGLDRTIEGGTVLPVFETQAGSSSIRL